MRIEGSGGARAGPCFLIPRYAVESGRPIGTQRPTDALPALLMITGYNTDVRHGEVVFHVQTEDKGAANPFIESMVYVGGQVLATKRANYADLLAAGRDEKEIVALMDHQHRTMIAAIRHGKFDGKLAALASAKPKTAPVALVVGRAAAETPLPPPEAATATAAAVPVPERTLDQVILEYLTNEADQEQLVLVLEGESDLSLGRRAALALRTTSSKSGLPVSGAQVSVRMISTISEPRVLAAGRTDDQGALPLRFEIPRLDRGTAALIISAVSSIGRAELKHLL
ncbi:MAG TPA: hypothetical protein VHR45_21525 [Thermoanaerobaculia bacterium]|nr:hypothetical protein [Thermoanaerobaculia bacterium]